MNVEKGETVIFPSSDRYNFHHMWLDQGARLNWIVRQPPLDTYIVHFIITSPNF